MQKGSLMAIFLGVALGCGTGADAATYNLEFTNPSPEPIAPGFGNNAEAQHFYRGVEPGVFGNAPTLGDLWDYTTGYGDLTGAAWTVEQPAYGEIRIEAVDPTQTVTIDSFELGGWITDQSAEWVLFDLAWNQIGGGGGIAPGPGAHLDVAPNTAAVGGVILQWGTDAWYVGLNNLTYSVSGNPAPVPVPATAGLLAAAIGGLAAVRKRRRFATWHILS